MTHLKSFILLILLAYEIKADIDGLWAIMGGDRMYDQTGFADYPSARYGFASVHDGGDIMYLFGGNGLAALTGRGLLCDFWSYNFTSNQWRQLGGPQTSNYVGDYTHPGQFHPDAWPAGREGASLVTYRREIYLFGGSTRVSATTVYLSDLWKYNLVSRQWMYVEGTGPGVDNPIEVSPRSYFAMGSSNAVGSNVKLFHVYAGESQRQDHIINDFFAYENSSTDGLKWRRLFTAGIPSGVAYASSQSISSDTGPTGALEPGIIMFGGKMNISNIIKSTNALFYYSYRVQIWSLKSGVIDQIEGRFWQMGVFSDRVMPGSRYSAYSAYNTDKNHFILFGGYGSVGSSTIKGNLNDLWIFDVVQGLWCWVYGLRTLDQDSAYEAPYGVLSDINIPGARYGGTGFFFKNSFYAFGGYRVIGAQSYYSNDLWRFQFDFEAAPRPQIYTDATTTSSSSSSLRSTTPSRSESSTTIQSRQLIPVIVSRNRGEDLELTQIVFIVLGAFLFVVGLMFSVYFGRAIYRFYSRQKFKARKRAMNHASSDTLNKVEMRSGIDKKGSTNSLVDVPAPKIDANGMFTLPNSLEINKDFFDLEKHQFDSRDTTVFYGHALDSKMRKYSKELLIYKYAENFFTATDDESSIFIREVCFHHMFRKHENFVRILGYCTDPLVYVQKYYKDYTLYDALHHGEITFTKRQRYDIIYEISSGISIMHKSGVAHNALCAQKIFFENQDDDYKAFISGFYMATLVSQRKAPPIYNFDFMDDDRKTIFYRYAAPEILQGIKKNDLRYQTERISKSVDIYSLGCLICEIITGKVLWRKRKTKRTSHDDKDKGFSANNSTTQSSLSPIHDND